MLCKIFKWSYRSYPVKKLSQIPTSDTGSKLINLGWKIWFYHKREKYRNIWIHPPYLHTPLVLKYMIHTWSGFSRWSTSVTKLEICFERTDLKTVSQLSHIYLQKMTRAILPARCSSQRYYHQLLIKIAEPKNMINFPSFIALHVWLKKILVSVQFVYV